MSNSKKHNFISVSVEKFVFNKKQPLSNSRFNAVDADISFEFAQLNIIIGDSGTGKTELLKHIHWQMHFSLWQTLRANILSTTNLKRKSQDKFINQYELRMQKL